jgi:hypothetical protein
MSTTCDVTTTYSFDDDYIPMLNTGKLTALPFKFEAIDLFGNTCKNSVRIVLFVFSQEFSAWIYTNRVCIFEK